MSDDTSTVLPHDMEPSTSDDEEISFKNTISELKKCQWYFGSISASTAERLLRDQRPGTFLLRDSSNSRYFFSFTYQTVAGIFHSHVALHKGKYCLGGPNSLIKSSSLVRFVEKAMESSRDKNHYNILMHPDPSKAEERIAAVDIQFPFNRCSLLPSLKFLCRVVIRHSIRSETLIPKLPLSKSLCKYVASRNYLCPAEMLSICSRRFQSIFALSSGSLPSALAIVRITGKESRDALSKLTRRPYDKFESHRLFYTPLYDKEQIIDRGMAVFLKGPNTFTGEDTVELYCHGSRAVVDALLKELSQFPNLRPSKAGEFTRRAFFNSKLNLSQLEALGDLLNAETSSQLRLAHKQQEASKRLDPIRTRLIKLIARLEAAIDFAEDMENQQSQNWMNEFRDQVKEMSKQLWKLVESTRKGMLIRSGICVALIGRTNVGKSSILNKLASRDVAIVSNIPGTTRDSLEVRLSLANIPVTVTDTAGLRQTTDELEREGISRSINRSNESHIVVFVIDGERLIRGSSVKEEMTYLQEIAQLPDYTQPLICINKSDLFTDSQQKQLIQKQNSVIFTNTLHEEGIRPLIDELSQKICTLGGDEGQELFLSRERHLHLLIEAVDSLDTFQESFGKDIAIAAQNLRDAAESIGEIAGSVVNERILDELFSEFCIGK